MLLVHYGSVGLAADTLARRVTLGASFNFSPSETRGVLITGLAPVSQLKDNDFRVNDLIVKVNNTALTSMLQWGQITRGFRGGQRVTFEVRRKDTIVNKTIVLKSLPMENPSGVDVIYSQFTNSKGIRLRLIVTKPKNVSQPHTTLYLLSWLSAAPVESMANGLGGLFEDLSKKYVLVRIEKQGTGDSEGPDISVTDFHTDVNNYVEGLSVLEKYPFIDKTNVILLGISTGAAYAPMVAAQYNFKGIICTGGFVKTWYEHMIDHERRRAMLSGTDPSMIDALIAGWTRFYYQFLVEKKSPADIVKSDTALAKLWRANYGGDHHQYGRHMRYFQQLQDLELLKHWAKVNVPVLLFYGEYDWVMSPEDHWIIKDHLLSRKIPVKLEMVAQMDHSLNFFDSQKDAFDQRNMKNKIFSVSALIENWVRSL